LIISTFAPTRQSHLDAEFADLLVQVVPLRGNVSLLILESVD
jgi:hypothetical protein